MKQFRIIIAFLMISVCSFSVNAQLLVNQTNKPFTITFDNTMNGVNQGPFLGEGFRPNPNLGQIDSDGFRAKGLSGGSVLFGGTNTSGSFARGVDSIDVDQGGIYSFEVKSNNYTLGGNPKGGDFRPGSFTLLVINSTNQVIDLSRIAYEFWYYNSEHRNTRVEFYWSVDDVNFNNVPNLTYTTPTLASNNPVWENSTFQTTIDQNLKPGDSLYLRWSITSFQGSGPSADQFGLNDISVVMEESAFLPVQLVSFGAQPKKGNTELIWKTAEEINNDHFQIQHSMDAENWNAIGKVAAKETLDATNSYSFVHKEVQSGYNYYRLKQVDRDGSYDYSPVRKVHFSDKLLNKTLSVYPKPANEVLYIDNVNMENWESFRIINQQGKVIRQFDNSIPQQIRISGFPKGVYWLTAHSKNDTVRKKFIVQ